MLYELLYIVPTPYTETDLPEIRQNVVQIIKDAGGEISREEDLGNKKLAYPVKQVRRGFYILINFNAPSQVVKSIEQKLKLLPTVLRFQTVEAIISKKTRRPAREKPATRPEAETKAEEKPAEKIDLKTLGEEIDKLLEI